MLAKFKNPVVLFDEIEKAHPDMIPILLQLFDEVCTTNIFSILWYLESLFETLLMILRVESRMAEAKQFTAKTPYLS